MKKTILSFISVALIVATLISCAQKKDTVSEEASTKDRISIVTTIFPPYDFARAIIADKADLSMLIHPGAEVHSFDPTPADIIKIQNADVFIYIGGENDEWVKTILEPMDTSKKKIIRLMDCVSPVEEETVEGMEAEEGGEADVQEGEANQINEEEVEFDEHIWTSPKNAILMVNGIMDALCEIDGKNAQTYKENAAVYTANITQVQSKIKGIVDSSPNKLIVFGDRFPFRYFADEFALTYKAAFNGCSTDSEASAETLAYLINTIKENKIPYVYYIELSNQNIAKAISEQTGAGMLLLHSCHNVTKADFDAGVTYLALMQQNAESLKKGLGVQ